MKIETVDQYISQFEESVQQKLRELRITIRKAAPDAQEKMAWSMPYYGQNGFLVQFAAHKKHIGFYCSPGAIAFAKDELEGYSTDSKNTIHFPLDKDVPLDLVEKIVLFRINENANGWRRGRQI